jgi:hypothetical protein
VGLRRKLLDVVLRDLPDPDSELHDGSPRYDELLGGKKAEGVWGRYSRNFGTTCIVTLDGWMLSAGFPDDMVVAHDTPTGGGTPILRALYVGSDQRGWTRTPKRGELPDLRSGDIYVSNHATKDGSDGTHVGLVTEVRRAADGKSMEVDTADGGQGTRQDQYMGRQTRTFRVSTGPHPVTISSKSGESWLERWIAVGGDDLDDLPLVPSSPVASGEGGAGAGVAVLGVLGIAMLAGGLYWYLESKPRGVNALAPARQDVTVALRARHGDVRDFEARRRFELALAGAGFEVTGAGTSFGPDRRVTETDVDVRCRGACDEARLREVARRAGVEVSSVRAWEA